MNATYSKSAFLYTKIRRRLQSGRYMPGQRIDPGTIASEFETSPTPVRSALDRLVGQGLLEDHARSGMLVPLPNEVVLRDRYDWMARLLLMACQIGPSTPNAVQTALNVESRNADLVKLTWQLFDDIARATRHRSLHRAVKQTNDQLAPIRRAKQGILGQPVEELSELVHHWRARDIRSLEPALRKYHERRKRLVPCIVAMLIEQSSCLD
jgi:DNA-binding GntR family transcriptional regulator